MQLLKLETILNVATMGYSVLWLEPHTLVAGALPWPACTMHAAADP